MRYKVGDNYEECYLRITALEKALKAKEKYADIVKDPEFKKVVKYIARKTYNRNSVQLSRHGFELEDMENIVTLYGIMFMNSKNTGPTSKDRYYLMMRFLNQKLETFYLFMDRKFKVRESFGEVAYDERVFSVPAEDVFISTEDAEFVETKMPRKKKQVLKKEMEQNIHLYKDELQRLATSKFVDYHLRKAARNICKKNNLDYVEWAKSLIVKNNLDTNDFVLEV